MGTSRLWSVPYAMTANNLAGSIPDLLIEGNSTDPEEPLFEVRNKDGQTVFAVYNEGVRIYVDYGAKGKKGGFAIGGFGSSKESSQDLFIVNNDSIRAYIDPTSVKGKKGGFSIGGFSSSKTGSQDLLFVNYDSIRAYIDQQTVKGKKGGFSIGGFSGSKGLPNDYLSINSDSTIIYVRKDSLNSFSSFDIISLGNNYEPKSLLTANPDTVNIAGVLNLQKDLVVAGNISVEGSINLVSDIEGNSYKTVNIGTQVWMAENLKTTKYNDGTAIPMVTLEASWQALLSPGFCWYNNDAATYKNTYGALYNWYAVDLTSTGGKNICPVGWHIPGDPEFTILIDFLGGNLVAGGKLKETGTVHWDENNGATDDYGFTALPGGMRKSPTGFSDLRISGLYWSSTEIDTGSALNIHLTSYWPEVYRVNYTDKHSGYSIRCLKDN